MASKRYERVKEDLWLNLNKFVRMELGELSKMCDAFVNTGTMIGVNAATPAASGASTTPVADTTDRNQPPRPPSNRQVKVRLAEAATTCPLCLVRHLDGDCRRLLREGWIAEHNPSKAKAKLDELGPQPNRPPRNKKQSGK